MNMNILFRVYFWCTNAKLVLGFIPTHTYRYILRRNHNHFLIWSRPKGHRNIRYRPTNAVVTLVSNKKYQITRSILLFLRWYFVSTSKLSAKQMCKFQIELNYMKLNTNDVDKWFSKFTVSFKKIWTEKKKKRSNSKDNENNRCTFLFVYVCIAIVRHSVQLWTLDNCWWTSQPSIQPSSQWVLWRKQLHCDAINFCVLYAAMYLLSRLGYKT